MKILLKIKWCIFFHGGEIHGSEWFKKNPYIDLSY